MLNETTGALFYAIPPAIGAATGGDVLIAVGRAFSADPQLDFAGKALTLRSRSVLRQPAGGLYTLAHDSSLEAARGRDLTLQGELIAPADASVSLSGSTFTVTAGGTLTLAAGAGVTLAAPAGSALGGTATLGAGAALRASAALTLGGAPPDFVRRVVSTTAAGAWTAGAADLDGSGGVDIFFASEGDNTIGWHQNLGGSPPEFTRWAISSTARGAHGIFPADLDADGHTDLLATYGPNQGSVVWYQNDGGMPASFSERAIAAVRGAFSVFAADVDSDGDLDVLSASNEDDTVAWYESDGGASPSFTRRVISSSADGAQSVFAADLDGDADTDVLSASYSNDTVAWHENGGEPAPVFAERVISRAADGATSVFAADLDGDGDLDVLSASLVGGTVDWYENQGGAAPAFTGRPITGEAAGAFSVSAADVDGDGDLDVLSASRDDDTVAWHENLGGSPPAFATHVVSTAGDGPLSAAATDLDGDGDLDVLSASSLDSTIAWHENQGGGLAVLEPGSALEAGGALKNLGALFASGGTITSAGPFTNDGEAAFSGDCAVHGDLDTSGLLGIEDGTLAVSGDLRATAPPTFTRRVISAAADASSVFAVDLDGDCDTDVLSTSALDDRIALCSNDGEASPRFLSETAFAGDNPVSVFAADLDGNGLPDPLSASYADGTIAWYRKEGASSLSRRVISAAEAGARSVSAADVDGDGDVDVLSASSVGNTISWHENNGASPPAFFAHVIATGAAGARSVAAADLDLDGDADVLSAENADNTVAWYENRGGSPVLFVRHVLSTSVPGASSLPGPASVAAADLDGDGDMDALAAFYSGNTVAWFENDGVSPASFTIRVISAAAAGAHSIHARDLDGDGDEDVLAALHLADSVAWYESDGRAPPAFTERFIGLAEGAYSVFAADVDGDGRIDALSAAADGDTVAWYESSDGGSQGAAAGRRGAITGEGAGGLAIGGTFAAAADTSLLLPSSALSVAVGGDFDAAIDNASRFDMAFAELRLAPSGGETRTLEVMSTDIGPDPAGLDRSLPGHFPLGVLAIGPGTVELVDRRDNDRRGQAACEAVYAGAVEVEAGATLLNDGCKVYYGTLVLDGTASRPENLIPLLSGSSPKLRRGDADSSGVLDISDAVRVLGFLFLGGVTLPCKEAADTDDSGVLDISDAVRILGFLFLGTAPPAPPGAACGPDPQGSPDLGCEEASC